MGLKAMREVERRASEAKCPLPAEEGWVMEKKRERKKERKKRKEGRKEGFSDRCVKKPMVGEPWVF